ARARRVVRIRAAPASTRSAPDLSQGGPVSADKPKGPVKPFLGDDELSSELDAWDEMFDNLHAGPEAGGAVEEPMAWPTPAPQPQAAAAQDARVSEPASSEPDAGRTLDDFPPVFEPRLDPDLEDQLTLDRAVKTTGE